MKWCVLLMEFDRFASNIASEGFIVALPSSFHEFEGPEAIPYDAEGTDRGNRYKIEKTVEAYDEVRTVAFT
jgi:carboxymethylenebutenolidase